MNLPLPPINASGGTSMSRAQALDAGILVDITKQAKRFGFTVPVAIAQHAWSKIPTDGLNGALIVTHAKFRDLTYSEAEQPSGHVDLRQQHAVGIGITGIREDRYSVDYINAPLWADLGGGDRGEPVLTIMASDDL